MATAKQGQSGTLEDFSFDSPEDFFDIKGSGAGMGSTIDEVLEEDDDTGTTSLDTDAKGKAVGVKDAAEIEEEATKDFTPTKKKDEAAPAKKPDKKDEKGDKGEEEGDDEEETEFFKEEKPDAASKDTKETGTKADTLVDDEVLTLMALELKERGILNTIEIKDGEKVTEDMLIDSMDAEIEARVTESVEAFAETMDEDGKAFLTFKKNGGKSSDFIQVYTQNSFELEELDVEDKKQVAKVLTYYVTNYEDVEAEDVEDRVKYLQEGGKAAQYAVKWFKAIKDDEKAAKEDLQRKTAEQAQKRDENAKAFRTKVDTVLKATNKIGVFPINKADQAELGDYINKPTVKIAKNKFVPQLHIEIGKALNPKTDEDVKTLIAIAKLLKSKFDIQDIVTKTNTEVTKQARKNIGLAKEGHRIKSTGGNGVDKQLSDYF